MDEVLAQDPNRTHHDGKDVASEWLYGQRMSMVLSELCAEPSAHLEVAARAQHLRRREVLRGSHAATRVGYLQWRREAALHTAKCVRAVLTDSAWPDTDIEIVERLIRKLDLKPGKESPSAIEAMAQTLEDCVALLFVRFELAAFREKHSREKVAEIVEKTAKKVSPDALSRILTLLSASQPR